MGITIADIIDEDGLISVRCAACKRLAAYRGRDLLARFGYATAARDLQRRLQCASCGMVGEIKITFPSDALQRERLRLGLRLHDPF